LPYAKLYQTDGNLGGNWTVVCHLSDGGAFFAGVWTLSCRPWFT